MKINIILIALSLGVVSCTDRPTSLLIKPDLELDVGTSKIIGVNHVGISVANLEDSVDFYTKSAGLKTVSDTQAIDSSFSMIAKEDLSGRVQILKGPNTYIRIMEFDQKNSGPTETLLKPEGPGPTHICYIGPKADPIDGQFVQNGATWESSKNAMVDMRGVGYMYGYLRDPDGVMLEVELAPEPNFRGHMWFGHIATATPDLTKTIEFYREVLGYEPYRRSDDIEGEGYDEVVGIKGVKLHGAWFRVAPFYSLEFWQFVNPKTEVPAQTRRPNEIGYNLIALETTDIDADFKRLKSLGITLETDIVKEQDGRAFYFRDLDGNLLALMEFVPGSKLSLKGIRSY